MLAALPGFGLVLGNRRVRDGRNRVGTAVARRLSRQVRWWGFARICGVFGTREVLIQGEFQSGFIDSTRLISRGSVARVAG